MLIHLRNSLPRLVWIFVLFLVFFDLSGQENILNRLDPRYLKQNIVHYHYRTDTLNKSSQNINIIQVFDQDLKHYNWDIAYSDTLLFKTSKFGLQTGALVALNGSYFDMANGGSVTYFEMEGIVIDTTRDKRNKNINGALIIDKNGNLRIEYARNERLYSVSGKEHAVLVSGPVLILNGSEESLKQNAFTTTRHPRTCLCQTRESTLLITIDGRRPGAAGMSLNEVQDLMTLLGCQQGLNLDGGGSTTLWINSENQGRILNQPSDPGGERPVANAIVLLEQK